jgi:hypothetical protein
MQYLKYVRLFSFHSYRSTMVPLTKKLERQPRLPPSQLLFATLIIAILISSLSVFHVVSSECCSYFRDADVATLLPLLVLSPAVESTSLASQQSYGLFDDIPSRRWEFMRKQAHEQHTHVQKDVSTMSKTNNNNTPIFEYMSNNVEVRK